MNSRKRFTHAWIETSPEMLKIEAALVLTAILIAATRVSLMSRFFERMELGVRRLSRNNALSVAIVGLMALGLRAALLPILPIPQPLVHDEFAYLLAADTFAHGRLTNPTHPMWPYFETSGVIQRPTYQCYAQPGQGMLLALGKILFGHPFWAVWLSVGLMCALITWMLQAWFPPHWALFGGVVAIVRFGVFSYWANSYWGGALAAIGGSLVLGALPRIKGRRCTRDAFLMGLGLAILANTRPYEGLVFSLPVAFALLAWMLGTGRPATRILLLRVIAPLVVMLTLTGTELGYYFWRVTGSPLRIPYAVERAEYGVAPYMVWQNVRPEPALQHTVFKDRYIQGELLAYHMLRSPAGLAMKSFWAWQFYLGPLLSVPFLIIPLSLPFGFSWHEISSNARFLVIEASVFTLGLSLEVFYSPHYSAPATALVIALVLTALRGLTKWGNRMRGVFLTRSVAIIAILMFVLRATAVPLHIPVHQFYMFAWHQKSIAGFGREAVKKQLDEMPGRQLVIVQYAPNHDLFVDWVHNGADIDSSKVIWANDLGAEADTELLRFFRNRNVFLLKADQKPPQLIRYGAD